MARNIQLRQLVKDLRAEVGHSLNVAHGTNNYETLKYILRRTEEALWISNNWPQFRLKVQMPYVAASRYYNYPASMPYTLVSTIHVSQGLTWSKLGYGIGPKEYSAYNSDQGVQGGAYPLKWEHDPEKDQLELWPIPTQDGTMMLQGQQELQPMIEDSDTCTLDGMLIVLYAAAEIAAKNRMDDAQMRQQKAQALLNSFRAQTGSDKRGVWIMGGGDGSDGPRPRPGIDYIP